MSNQQQTLYEMQELFKNIETANKLPRAVSAIPRLLNQYRDCVGIIYGAGEFKGPIISYGQILEARALLQRNLPNNQRARIIVDISFENCSGRYLPLAGSMQAQPGDYAELPGLKSFDEVMRYVPGSIMPAPAPGRYFLEVRGRKWEADLYEKLLKEFGGDADALAEAVKERKAFLETISPGQDDPTDPEVLKRVNNWIRTLFSSPPVSELPPKENPGDFDDDGVPNNISETLANAVNSIIGGVSPILDPDEPQDTRNDQGTAEAPQLSALNRTWVQSELLNADVSTLDMRGLLEMYRAQEIELNDRLRGFIARQTGTVSAQPYIPGPLLGNYSIHPDTLRAMKGSVIPSGFNDFNGSIRAAFLASPELSAMYKPLLEGGFSGLSYFRTSLLFGRYRPGSLPPVPGNVTYFANPMFPSGGGWGVVISTAGNAAEEILLAKPDLTFTIIKSPVGTPAFTWSPIMSAVLADHSPAGQFWGPQMTRLRHFLDNGHSTYNPDLVVQLIFKASTHGIGSAKQFHGVFGRELMPLRNGYRPFPGCLLFGPKSTDIGVLMSDGTIWGLCANDGGQVTSYTWPQFRPLYVWFPHP